MEVVDTRDVLGIDIAEEDNLVPEGEGNCTVADPEVLLDPKVGHELHRASVALLHVYSDHFGQIFHLVLQQQEHGHLVHRQPKREQTQPGKTQDGTDIAD